MLTFRTLTREVTVAQIMEMIEGLVSKFFGGSAMPVIRQVLASVMEFVFSIIGKFSPAAA